MLLVNQRKQFTETASVALQQTILTLGIQNTLFFWNTEFKSEATR